jgi:integrase
MKIDEVSTEDVERVLSQNVSLAHCIGPRLKKSDEYRTKKLNEGETRLWFLFPTAGEAIRIKIFQILQWTMTTRKREFGENPASLNSIDVTTFQDSRKLRPIQSFRGTHYNDVAEFVAELRAAGGIAAAAFEFMILTASRPNEALGARYDEFDFDDKIWTVPKIRLKPGAERHVVPLSERAVEIVNTQIRLGDFVFPQRMQDKPITKSRVVRSNPKAERSA